MNGYLLGWVATFAVLVALALTFVIAAWLMPRGMGSRTAEIVCPWHRRRVMVRFVSDGEHPIGVMSCTAFADPQAVTCGAPCAGGQDRLLMDAGRPAELIAD